MYLAIARDFILNGNWQQIDPYVYPGTTDGQLIWAHEYLSYVFFYGAWASLGVSGLIFLKMLALGLMFWFVLSAPSAAQNRRPLWMMLWVLAILAGSFRYIERGSMFSDLFTVVLACWLLQRDRIDRGLILRLSALFVIWVQMHPGFVVGLIFLTLWMVWRTWQQPELRDRRLLWLLLPVGLLFVNPRGLEGILYPFEFSLNEAQVLRNYNFEWFPSWHPAFRFTPEVFAFWTLSVACFVMFLKERAWRTLHALFAFTAFLLALQAVRFIPWASMVMVLCVKPIAVMRLPLLRHSWIPYAFAAMLLAISVRNFGWGYRASSGTRIPALAFDPKFFPTTTLEFLRRQPIPGRLYNSHDLGSSLIWNNLIPVFHHGFVTDMKFFKNDVTGVMASRESFVNLAAKHNWTMLLVHKLNGYSAMHKILSPLPEWKIVAEDPSSYLIYKLPD